MKMELQEVRSINIKNVMCRCQMSAKRLDGKQCPTCVEYAATSGIQYGPLFVVLIAIAFILGMLGIGGYVATTFQ